MENCRYRARRVEARAGRTTEGILVWTIKRAVRLWRRRNAGMVRLRCWPVCRLAAIASAVCCLAAMEMVRGPNRPPRALAPNLQHQFFIIFSCQEQVVSAADSIIFGGYMDVPRRGTYIPYHGRYESRQHGVGRSLIWAARKPPSAFWPLFRRHSLSSKRSEKPERQSKGLRKRWRK